MPKNTLYLETSVFGFYYDDEAQNILRKNAVRQLFTQINSGKFIPIVSPLTVKELSKSPSPHRETLLSLLEKLQVKEIQIDEKELETLAEKYIAEGIIPEDFADDARHIAFATISKVDILLSYNLKHIANEWKIRKINSVNLREGYNLLTVRSPEEVIEYED